MDVNPQVILDSLAGLLLVMAAILTWAIWVLAGRLNKLHARYDQFRGEVAETMSQAFEQIADADRRLALAGYPPGRQVPLTEPGPQPAWLPPKDPNRR